MSDAEPIRLDQYLKLVNAVSSGGEAKHFIQDGAVIVNGEVETRRGKKLANGDTIEFNGEKYVVEIPG